MRNKQLLEKEEKKNFNVLGKYGRLWYSQILMHNKRDAIIAQIK